MDAGENTVFVEKTRWEFLLQLESGLSKRLEDAIQDYKKQSLARLHQKDKLNPQANNARAKRYVNKHKHSINARRREKRLLQKQVPQEKLREVVSNPPTLVENVMLTF